MCVGEGEGCVCGEGKGVWEGKRGLVCVGGGEGCVCGGGRGDECVGGGGRVCVKG